MERKLERILPKVQKPARYTGGEYNAVVKDKASVTTRVALCFPDTYEIGMSNLGVRILYGIMNEIPEVWCERVFAPWGDMEEAMRAEGIPLYGLESGDPIGDFDLIGFSLGYEMAYTNMLNMLDLAGLPIRAEERTDLSPIIVAGGTCVYNAEPLAPFVDIFSLGEGEEVTVEMIRLYQQAKAEGWDKPAFLKAAAQIPGLYVPSLYDISYKDDGTIDAITPKEGAPAVITKRIIQDMDSAYFPVKTIIPSTEIVHDRVMLEVFRGCIRGCRFCQAGYAYRPVRTRSPELLVQQGIDACKDSGYQEMTLSSLSTSDYKPLEALCDGLLEWCEPNRVNLSLPSLRADNFSMGLMHRLQKGRKAGLTFAPEAGTQRLRDAINKNVTEEEILRSCATAFSGGWSSVKLYFMLGLPGENELVGEGISFCAVCDGDFFSGRRVCVAGGGNSALQEAILLSGKCSEGTMLQDLPAFTGEKKLQEILFSRPNVKALTNVKITGLRKNGEDFCGVTVEDRTTGEETGIDCEGLFVAIGLIPENEAFRDLADLNSYGYFDSAEDCLTKTPGVFVAGDCRSKTVRQLTTAAGDGAVAALAACRYIDSNG